MYPQNFTTPNPAYWRFVDSFLDYCESSGILVFRDGQSEGTTPLTYGVNEGESVALRLVKEGYVSQRVVLDGDQTKVRVVMVKQGASSGGQGGVR